MTPARKPLPRLVVAALVVAASLVSCVGGDDPTGVPAEVGIALQPDLIPSAADGSALPVNRIHAVVTRQPDGVVLREQRVNVSPTAASWTIDVAIPVAGQSVEVVIYLYLLNVDGSGIETVQFSGRTDPTTVSAGARLTNVSADLVRGPLANLLVTGVTITSYPATMSVGGTGNFTAVVQTSAPTSPRVFWTSLDGGVVSMTDSVGTGVNAGTASVVASAGAFADTVSVVVTTITVDSVHVTPDSADVVVGQSRAYTATLFDAGGNVITRPVSWSTGNSSVATVNGTGQVTGVAPGTTTVQATSDGISDQAVVRVTAAPTGGALNVWLAGPGTWSNASKWSLGRVPSAADTVHIIQGSGYTVTLDANATVGAMVIGAPVSLRIEDATLTLTGSGLGPEVDVQAAATLELIDGSVIAGGITSAGTVRTGGSLSRIEADSIVSTGQWTVDEGVQLTGNDGVSFRSSGTISLANGAAILTALNGEITYVGGSFEGTGSLLLGPGSSLILGSDLSFDGPNLQVQGSILEDDSESLTVGPTSSMQLIGTTDPIVIDVDGIYIQGTVLVAGSNITATTTTIDIAQDASLLIEDDGNPLTFTTGSVVNAGTLAFVATSMTRFGPGASGTITNGPTGYIQTISSGTTVLDGELINEGSILIAGATELVRENAGAPFAAHHSNAATATIELVTGGSLDIFLGGADPSFTNSGTITVGQGTTLYVENMSNPAGQIIANAGARFEGTGAVDLRGGPPALPPLGGFNNGRIAPGLFGPGVLTWLGTVPMAPNGSIEIEIDGPAAGSGFDQLNVSAQLILNGNGTLDMSGSTYAAFFGDRFPIISYGERQGDFADVIFPNISGVTFDTLTVVTQSPTVPDTLVVYVSDGPSPADILGDWTLDEGQGQTTFDILGQGNHGILGSGVSADASDPAWIAGRIGGALRFAGGSPSDFVQVLDNSTLEPTQLTVEAFVRATTPGVNTYIVSKGGGPMGVNNAAYGLYTAGSGGLQFYTGTEDGTAYFPTADAGAGVWDGHWHHVAGTFDGSQVRLFVDGAEVGVAQPASMSYATAAQNDLVIGGLHTNGIYGFTGDIDEVRIWSRALTPSEIAARATRGGTVLPLDAFIGPPGTDADAVDAPGNAVNLVGTMLNGQATTLAAGAASPPTIDFNTFGGVDRTTGFERSDLLAARADQKHDGSPLILDTDNDGSFADEVAEQGFGMHANRFVTFDLAVIRTSAGLPANQAFLLSGVAGPANFLSTNGISLAVLVDGVPVVLHDAGATLTTSLSFTVPVSGSARYLTFAALDYADEFGDHGGFARVQLSR
ncbi:MAG: LamG-like jellyroll fold domain-containing protein [Gemmatimonadales bacterium]